MLEVLWAIASTLCRVALIFYLTTAVMLALPQFIQGSRSPPQVIWYVVQWPRWYAQQQQLHDKFLALVGAVTASKSERARLNELRKWRRPPGTA